MIHFEFLGSVVEGQVGPHDRGGPTFTFQTQFPGHIPVVEPVFNGSPLPFAARVRNRQMGQETSLASEYVVRGVGDLVITSYMSLKSSGPRTFRLGVREKESGILILEENPEAVGGYPWFINGDFIEQAPDGSRSVFAPWYEEPAERTLGDRLDALGRLGEDL